MVWYLSSKYTKELNRYTEDINFIDEDTYRYKFLNENIECSLGYSENGVDCIDIECISEDGNIHYRFSLFKNKNELIEKNGECFFNQVIE